MTVESETGQSETGQTEFVKCGFLGPGGRCSFEKGHSGPPSWTSSGSNLQCYPFSRRFSNAVKEEYEIGGMKVQRLWNPERCRASIAVSNPPIFCALLKHESDPHESKFDFNGKVVYISWSERKS